MYGPNTELLRDSLRELLTQHRVQQRIGGPGLHTVPERTTVDERRQIGELIGRYRHAVLVWCHHAVVAANPHVNLGGTSPHARGPAEELRNRLRTAITNDPAGLPDLGELTTEQPFELVNLWRNAARASALGEHDFGAGVGYGRLSEAQCMTVIHDAAEITHALISLDRRYANIPGWQPLKEPGRLARAAGVCAAYSGYIHHDYSVDHRGWQPPTPLIDGPGLPGISGVLQAQHNLLIHLSSTFPDATSLRVVMDSQRIVSRAVARLLDDDPGFASRWQGRDAAYGRLIHATRDLGGVFGNGGSAAGQGALAAARMQDLAPEDLHDTAQLRHLDRLSVCIDERVRRAIEQGIKENHYFQNVTVPGETNEHGDLVPPRREAWHPIDGSERRELLAVVRGVLRPTVLPQQPAVNAQRTRRDFEAAITPRPRRGSPSDAPSL